MAKKIIKTVKLNIPAGAANPAPPVGPALGQAGIAIMDFCNAFNERTREMGQVTVPVVITVYEDRSFTFITKTPPTAELLKKAAGIEKGSGVPNKEKVGSVSKDKIREIAEIKMVDLNTSNLESAMATVSGTAKNLGLSVED